MRRLSSSISSMTGSGVWIWSSLSPQSRTIRPGTPTTVAPGGTSRRTTALAAMRALSPTRNGPEHLCAGADHDVVAERRMALADVLAGAAERHALIEQAVVADLGRLADHDAGAVVNDQTAADLRAGVDFNSGPHLRPLRDRARDKKAAMPVKPVRDAVIDRRVQAVVQQHDLDCRRARQGRFFCMPGYPPTDANDSSSKSQ